jgi:hypothetical protein
LLPALFFLRSALQTLAEVYRAGQRLLQSRRKFVRRNAADGRAGDAGLFSPLERISLAG